MTSDEIDYETRYVSWIAAAMKRKDTSGCSGHAAGPTALPLKADLQAAMSASPPISSASPPGTDLPGDAPVRLVLTGNRLRSRSSTQACWSCWGRSVTTPEFGKID